AAAYTMLCSASLITQGSDCALLATGTAMAILFACSFDEKEKLLRWLELLLMILLSWRVIGLIQLMAGECAVDAGGLMSFLTQSPYLWLLPVAVLILWILVSRKNVEVIKYKKLRTALLLMIPAAIILGIGYIVLNTLGALPQGLSSDNGYLLFDDEWGSARGIIWKSSVKVIVENFREHPLKLLFGEGPDAFTAAAYETAGEALKAKWPGKLVPNAHNEWLNMLINYGLVGGGLYISVFVMAVKRCISGMKNRPELMLPLICIAAYIVHNFFCYQQIICTAPAFIIMGTVFRKTEE
nr:O-antigen ligase family protein [Lachnospiraceae bacterium]